MRVAAFLMSRQDMSHELVKRDHQDESRVAGYIEHHVNASVGDGAEGHVPYDAIPVVCDKSWQ